MNRLLWIRFWIMYHGRRALRLFYRDLRAGRFWNPGRYQDRRRAELEKLFQDVNDWLAKTGVDYWPFFGTLLGYYRERGILGHDDDVDFGLTESAAAILRERRDSLGPGAMLLDLTPVAGGIKFCVVRGGWEAELCFYRDVSGILEPTENSPSPNYAQSIPREFVFPLERVEFLDRITLVPARPRELLEFIYGNIEPGARLDPRTGFYH